MASDFYQFGPFQLEPLKRRLTRAGEVVSLTPKAFDALLVLVSNHGECLSRSELSAQIWPDTSVGEHNLNQCMTVLRKALEDNPKRPDYIATLPGRGYSFVAEVDVRPSAEGPGPNHALVHDPADPLEVVGSLAPARARWWTWLLLVAGLAMMAGYYFYARPRPRLAASRGDISPRTVKIRRSVAVLGFENLSRRRDTAWLSTALSEMLTSELGTAGDLRTIPGEEVARARTELKLRPADGLSPGTLISIQQNLGADIVVTGGYTVLVRGRDFEREPIRLDLRAQNVATGETVASTVQTGNVPDLFALVSRAGDDLRQNLNMERLSPANIDEARAASASNPEAERLYAEGLVKFRSFDVLGAQDLLQQAVALDPSFPPAHTVLADVWSFLGHEEDEISEIKKAFDLSIRLSREDQLLVQARYFTSVRDCARSIQTYDSLAGVFPDNVEYRLRLADAETWCGRAREALLTIEGARKLPGSLASDLRIDMGEAQAASALSDFRRTATMAARAAETARVRRSRSLQAHALSLQSSALSMLGDTRRALQLNAEAREICSELHDQSCVAATYRRLGVLDMEIDPQGAKRAFRQALQIARQIGSGVEEGNDLNGLATVLANEGDFAEADPLYRHLLANDRENHRPWGVQMTLNNLGEDLVQEGKLAEANRMEEEALAVSRESGQKIGIADELLDIAHIQELEGDLDGAESHYQEALSVFRQIGGSEGIAQALSGLGDLARDRRDLLGARRNYEQALTLLSFDGHYVGQLAAERLTLARLLIDEGRTAEAADLARQAADGFVAQKRPNDEARARAFLALALSSELQTALAATEIDRSVWLISHSQSRLARLEVSIIAARVKASAAAHSSRTNLMQAVRGLESATAEAKARRFVSLELEARLAWDEIEIRSERHQTGQVDLATLQKEAESKGFLLVAHRAAAAAKVDDYTSWHATKRGTSAVGSGFSRENDKTDAEARGRETASGGK